MAAPSMPVILSSHALLRARERLTGVPRHELEEFVRTDVRAALREGRVAKRHPPWLVSQTGMRGRTGGPGSRRIAWSHDELRAYVWRSVRDERGTAIVVLTVLVPAA